MERVIKAYGIELAINLDRGSISVKRDGVDVAGGRRLDRGERASWRLNIHTSVPSLAGAAIDLYHIGASDEWFARCEDRRLGEPCNGTYHCVGNGYGLVKVVAEAVAISIRIAERLAKEAAR